VLAAGVYALCVGLAVTDAYVDVAGAESSETPTTIVSPDAAVEGNGGVADAGRGDADAGRGVVAQGEVEIKGFELLAPKGRGIKVRRLRCMTCDA
jgi:hypothetical protein